LICRIAMGGKTTSKATDDSRVAADTGDVVKTTCYFARCGEGSPASILVM
jgi:hypothetical protein